MAQDRRKPVWIVVYEDQEGPGTSLVYPHKREALARVQELLESLVSEAFEEWGATPELEEIRNLVQEGSIETAMDQWNELDTDERIHFEQGEFYPPPKGARFWELED